MDSKKILLKLMTPVALILLASFSPSKTFAQLDTEDIALQKGLRAVRDAGESWIQKRGCVSCHQVPSLIWSHAAAQEAGIEVSQQDLDRWKSWSVDVTNFVKPEQKTNVDHANTMTGNVDTMIALLLAMPESRLQLGDDSDQKPDAWKHTFLQKLVELQADNGSWKACGQLPLQKRPELETQAVTTLWATYVLTLNHREFQQTKALEFADQIESPQSTEWWAVRLLVAKQLAAPNADDYAGDLVKRQNKDGGWGFLTADNSDALGTGYAIYALSQMKSENKSYDEAIAAARKFLFDTQSENGGWEVTGTKMAAKDRVTPTASDWGTAWAIVGLIESRK